MSTARTHVRQLFTRRIDTLHDLASQLESAGMLPGHAVNRLLTATH